MTAERISTEFQSTDGEANHIWQMTKIKSTDCGRLEYRL